MNNTKNISDILAERLKELIAEGGASQAVIDEILKKVRNTKINILLVGATGAGKSSTINAIFDTEKARVGMGNDPETMEMECYELGNVILWDSPGLGDSPEKDAVHIAKIRGKLHEKNESGDFLVDLVLLILDGSNRDMRSAFSLLDVVLPALNKETHRLLVAINQADLAMKGTGWDHINNLPSQELVAVLEDKIRSVKTRLAEAGDITNEPVYYSAGRLNAHGEYEQRPYNVLKLVSLIMSHVEVKKRAVFLNDMNKDAKNFEHNDKDQNYDQNVGEQAYESWLENIKSFAKDVLGATGGLLKRVITSPEVQRTVVAFVTSYLGKKTK